MVDEATKRQLDALVAARIQKNEHQITHSLRQIAAGNPLGAEVNERRRAARLAIKTGLDRRQAEALSASIRQSAKTIEQPVPRAEWLQEAVRFRLRDDVRPASEAPPARPEAVWDTADFVGVEFFTRGRRAANAVGRVMFRNGRVQGTGFLVGPGLLLTNHHVIGSSDAAGTMCVQFDFERDDGGIDRAATVFGFDAGRCFAFSPIQSLDFTLVAIGSRLSGGKRLEDFGFVPLSDAGDKHMLGELANIIQHPDGRPKQIVIRENNLVARDETVEALHYLAETEPGSSGSPVFNNQWEAIALHHWAGPHLEVRGIDGRLLRKEINEGIRISAIVKALRDGQGVNDSRARTTVREIVQLWDAARRVGPVAPGGPPDTSESASPGMRSNHDGSVSWIFPIEINVRAPLLAPAAPTLSHPVPAAPVARTPIGEERRRVAGEDDYSDRGGYEPGFIPGFQVPLPDFSKVGYRIAKNLRAAGDDDRFELRYHHFSVVMNAERRLAAFTACNIDGSRIKAINRQTKDVTDNPTLKQLDAESFGAEASDAFRPDDRVDPEEQMGRDFYEDQRVPGFEKPDFPGNDAPRPRQEGVLPSHGRAHCADVAEGAHRAPWRSRVGH